MTQGSWKLRWLGGLAGILVGLVLGLLMVSMPAVPSSRSTTAEVVPTLSGGESSKLGEKASALWRVIEVRLRTRDFREALAMLEQTHSLARADRDQLYEKAADVVLAPAPSGGGAEDGKKYFEEQGGKSAVMAKLPELYRIARQAPDGPTKVALLIRMKNIYDFADPVVVGRAGTAPLENLPTAETLLGEAARIARNLPGDGSPWLAWGLWSAGTVVLGLIGIVLLEMVQELARCVVQEFTRQHGVPRLRWPRAEPIATTTVDSQAP